MYLRGSNLAEINAIWVICNNHFKKNFFLKYPTFLRMTHILKLQKNVNFEILATVPPFLRNENILGPGNPVQKSDTPN